MFIQILHDYFSFYWSKSPTLAVCGLAQKEATGVLRRKIDLFISQNNLSVKYFLCLIVFQIYKISREFFSREIEYWSRNIIRKYYQKSFVHAVWGLRTRENFLWWKLVRNHQKMGGTSLLAPFKSVKLNWE